MSDIGNAHRREVGRHGNNRAEISHLPSHQRERAMERFRRMESLLKFTFIHSSVYDYFNHQKNIESRAWFKSLRDVPLLEWRELITAWHLLVREKRRPVRVRLTATAHPN